MEVFLIIENGFCISTDTTDSSSYHFVDSSVEVFSTSFFSKLYLACLVKRLKKIYSNVEFVKIDKTYLDGRYVHIAFYYQVFGLPIGIFNYSVEFTIKYVFNYLS